MNARHAVKLLAAQAARFGMSAKTDHRREESRFSLMMGDADLPTMFKNAIKPMLPAIEGMGRVGIRLVGVRKEGMPALLAKVTAAKWKWFAMEDGSILILPRANGNITQEDCQTFQGIADTERRVQIGLGAVMRV